MKKNFFLPISIFLSALMLSISWIYTSRFQTASITAPEAENAFLEENILPEKGITLPFSWGGLIKNMAAEGVIDEVSFKTLYQQREGLPENISALFSSENFDLVQINARNSGILLNLLWAFGLGNKNSILEAGPMSDPQYGGSSGFASTGGWSLARGNAMDHFSKHPFVVLTPPQQSLVENVSKNIYRPCCDNSTYFPDCNHGMAMLGLLELLASQNIQEDEMYGIALQVNAYWFPDQYLTIGKYLKSTGISWQDADKKQLLGYEFSSSSGYRQILSSTQPVWSKKSGGGGCSA